MLVVTAAFLAGLAAGGIAIALGLRAWSGSSVTTASRRRDELLAETDRQVDAIQRAHLGAALAEDHGQVVGLDRSPIHAAKVRSR